MKKNYTFNEVKNILISRLKEFDLEGVEISNEDVKNALTLINNNCYTFDDAICTILEGIYNTLN